MLPRTTKSDPSPGSLLRFTTSDGDEFAERMLGLAPGLSCTSFGSGAMNAEICAASLPGLGIFSSTFKNFRVRSDVRPYYGVTIALVGCSQFRVESGYQEVDRSRVHLQHPDRLFDGRMNGDTFDSLQLCFDQKFLDTLARQMQGPDGTVVRLREILDFGRPEGRSFVRQALFIWNELLRGGSIVSSPLVAQESVNLLGALLLTAASDQAHEGKTVRNGCVPEFVRRAEEYLMSNLSQAVSIGQIAQVAGVSARSLSRGFRQHRATTIKGFIKDRRLEQANRKLLTADPSETNVTRIALDLGFDQLGRFSCDYKQTFGELPSESLAR